MHICAIYYANQNLVYAKPQLLTSNFVKNLNLSKIFLTILSKYDNILNVIKKFCALPGFPNSS